MAENRTVTDGSRSVPSVHRIEFAVDFPPGHAAAYLLEGDDPILIDAGDPSAGNGPRLEAGLADAGYEPADVAHVVCTHPHVDHVGLVPELREAGDPTIYAPATYRESLDRPLEAFEADVTGALRASGLPRETAAGVAAEMARSQGELRQLLPASAVDVWYERDDALAVGDLPVETVHTPGHQRDHCCLLASVGGERSLFSGDVAIRTFRSAAVHAWLTSEQIDAIPAYYRTLDRLESLEVDRVYPGHGPVHDALEEAVATSRESLDRLLETTAEAVRPSGTHAAHAAKARGGDRADGPWLPEAIAALAHLEREGRLESSIEDGIRYYRPA